MKKATTQRNDTRVLIVQRMCDTIYHEEETYTHKHEYRLMLK